MRTRWLVMLCSIVALGCGAPEEPADEPVDAVEQGSSGDEGATSECPYEADDSCMNEDNLADCRARAAECPGRLIVMESCPLQFGCDGGGETEDGDQPVSNEAPQSCEGHVFPGACMTEANLAQCREMSARCPGEVLSLESCPLQFACP